MERPYFFEGQSYELFGVAHLPAGGAAANGVVLCHAFGEEKLWSHRVFVNLARQLAQRGLACLRFDFMGHGDSDGQSEDCTLQSYFNDIDAAVCELRSIAPTVRSVTLIGLRFGATLAHLYGSRKTNVDTVIAWEPILDGSRYAKELLRINLTTQLSAFGEIKDDRQAIVDKMKAGEPANVDGYLISHRFFEELNDLNVLENSDFGDRIVCHVVQIAADSRKPYRPELQDFASRFATSTISKVQAPQFWREIKPFCSKPGELIATTLRCLESTDVE
jgi:exosortase A-associated hydrolase 2